MIIMEPSSPSPLAEQLPLSQLKAIIKEIGTIKKVRVENDEMDSIWDISADDVEKKKEICYMNPCIAQVLYTIKKLKEVYPAKTIFLGVEFLSIEQRSGFHFFIQIHYNNDIYIIDFSHDNCVFLYQ
ncbi:MAG: hypothetical protein LBG52_08335 [Candidatus Peribacteria bacterium]|nr:hypothetical protein [Candidatus Peribacteria bacterium]